MCSHCSPFVNAPVSISLIFYFQNYQNKTFQNELWKLIFWFMKIELWKWNFLVSRNFFMNFDLKNSCKNEFKDNNEKSCSWFRNKGSHKIDFKAIWPRNGHADSVEVKTFSWIYSKIELWRNVYCWASGAISSSSPVSLCSKISLILIDPWT